MSFASYREQHVAFLNKAVKPVDLTLEQLEGRSFGPETHKGPMVISSDPSEDNLGSKLVTLQSVQQLKDIAGISDDHFAANPHADRSVRYPTQPVQTDFDKAIERARNDNCALESLIHPADQKTIGQAMMAFIHGDSQKVKAFEPVINALRFPNQVLLTTGQDITVTPGNPLVIGPNSPYVTQDPVLGAVAIFGTVTVQQGGQIQILIPVTFKAAQINML
ncbi:hypothetical protein ABNQ38_03400 [Azospirillum sp. A29]|uniref:hypothetical protein n=1 Tax=Azospirillum sp. A29 TaxID=3160606 RepID=UPI00366DABBE